VTAQSGFEKCGDFQLSTDDHIFQMFRYKIAFCSVRMSESEVFSLLNSIALYY